jgi:hypothetical protein
MTLRLQAGGPAGEFSGMSTDSSGIFTTTADIADGDYFWRAKGPKFLATSGSLVLTRGVTTNVEMGLMMAGDCNNDNRVTAIDFVILKNTFGLGSGDPFYDARADFNGDDRVDVTDFSLMKGNFGQGGAPPIAP